jgi:hypothetical protein
MLKPARLALLATLLAPLSAFAQDYVQVPTTYHLQPGSTFQTGCWGPCACALSDVEPMRGTFTLSLGGIGSVTDFYIITDVQFAVPTFGGAGGGGGTTLTGSGHFLAGQLGAADHQSMDLDLSITPPVPPGANVQAFNSAFGSRTTPPPAISIELANSETGCPGTRVRIVASPFRSDWNASGAATVQDVFDFLADYFLNRADYNRSGATSVQDLFAFLGDWFVGV